MRRRLATLAWLLAPTLAAVLTATPAQAVATIDYVALGDSYSSGVGASGATGACLRSQRSYPPLWAQRTQGSALRFAACSGATTADVLRGQLGVLDAGTDLVSLTIGGNDAGFASTVVTCVLGTDGACRTAVSAARGFIERTLPARLDATYRAIRQAAPGARVVVLGYPRLFETTASCGIGGMSLAKRRVLNAGADDLTAVLAARAAAAGFTFVDVRAAFAGHGICARSPWINGFSLLRATDSFHPNTAGYAGGYLPAFTAATG